MKPWLIAEVSYYCKHELHLLSFCTDKNSYLVGQVLLPHSYRYYFHIFNAKACLLLYSFLVIYMLLTSKEVFPLCKVDKFNK